MHAEMDLGGESNNCVSPSLEMLVE